MLCGRLKEASAAPAHRINLPSAPSYAQDAPPLGLLDAAASAPDKVMSQARLMSDPRVTATLKPLRTALKEAGVTEEWLVEYAKVIRSGRERGLETSSLLSSMLTGRLQAVDRPDTEPFRFGAIREKM